ncbi:hypothetical protein PVAP13_8KG106901 [Panicum virgatum]|uniref:Uncharacterized protein n=1 Tax=Panicum virgatum TaxID=38727 RepID=A0A8T0PU30_PANVG|nr:hypothetical protein PVAP13_8KG106901 [Panicum virgatum]
MPMLHLPLKRAYRFVVALLYPLCLSFVLPTPVCTLKMKCGFSLIGWGWPDACKFNCSAGFCVPYFLAALFGFVHTEMCTLANNFCMMTLLVPL